MKIVFSIFFLFLFTIVSAQQKNSKFYGIISVNAGIPTGIFSSVYSFTAGANAGVGYSISQQTAFTGTVGYLKFFEKGGGEGISFVPILAGFQYHFIPEVFISLEAGAALPTYAHGGILACAIPAAGYQINRKLSASLNYTGVAQYGLLVGGVNVRLSYTF
ncbi:MAG TPA: hypothetical protein VIJ95_03965 [Hanamia sp.]